MKTSAALLVLREADTVAVILAGRSHPDRERVEQLIAVFDAKPFVAVCTRCKGQATLATVYIANHGPPQRPMYWCSDEHRREQSLASDDRVWTVKTYRDALGYVRAHRAGSNPDYRDLIRRLGRANGVPERITQAAADQFFGT